MQTGGTRRAGAAGNWEALAAHKYAQLVTYRSSGAGVVTPVWWAMADGRGYVATEFPSGKVKRLRKNPEILIAACGLLGRPRGPLLRARAREVGGDEARQAERVLAARFGLGRRLFQLLMPPIFRRQGKVSVYLEVELAEAAEGSH